MLTSPPSEAPIPDLAPRGVAPASSRSAWHDMAQPAARAGRVSGCIHARCGHGSPFAARHATAMRMRAVRSRAQCNTGAAARAHAGRGAEAPRAGRGMQTLQIRDAVPDAATAPHGRAPGESTCRRARRNALRRRACCAGPTRAAYWASYSLSGSALERCHASRRNARASARDASAATTLNGSMRAASPVLQKNGVNLVDPSTPQRSPLCCRHAFTLSPL